jgi:lysyl-tRNA synthetase class II
LLRDRWGTQTGSPSLYSPERSSAPATQPQTRTSNGLDQKTTCTSQRIQRIAEIEALGFQPYGHRFDFTHTIPQILAEYGEKTAEQLEPRVQVRVAGRIMTVRRMGKAGFAHLMQNGEQLQIYVRKDAVSEKEFALYQLSTWAT